LRDSGDRRWDFLTPGRHGAGPRLRTTTMGDKKPAPKKAAGGGKPGK
jgi:hypothetical protein